MLVHSEPWSCCVPRVSLFPEFTFHFHLFSHLKNGSHKPTTYMSFLASWGDEPLHISSPLCSVSIIFFFFFFERSSVGICSRADLLLLHKRMCIRSNIISSAEEILYHCIGRNSSWWWQKRAWPKYKNRFKCAFCESRCRLVSLLVQNSPFSWLHKSAAGCVHDWRGY